MEKLERWLQSRPFLFSVLAAAVLCWAFSTDGVVSEDVMPVGDSESYVLRGMTLYGYLHSAQWAQFWDTFTLPQQCLAPLHYWLFFLLPSRWASMTSYGATQVIATYGLLVLGAWSLCRALDRKQWAPALFLFCAAQNISLDYSYFYFADVPFMALGTLVMAWQIEAWRRPDWRRSLLAGAGAGLMFWVKAPNAIIFTATFVLAELIRFGLMWRESSGEGKSALGRNTLRHAGVLAAGYVPVTLAALACGGFQSIIQLINANEVSGLFVTTVEATGLFRLLYFPLCLTFFYHTVMLLMIFTVVGCVVVLIKLRDTSLATRRPASTPAPVTTQKSFPSSLLLPLLGAYFILGEFFSFGMANKEMRSLLILLPVFWLAIFWLLEKWRVRPSLVFFAAAFYVLGGLSQVFYNGFQKMGVNSEGYQLTGDWLTRLPQAHPLTLAEIGLTKSLLHLIDQALPEGGKIAVGTEQLYVTSESLIWCQEHDLALQGKPVPCEFNNFLTNKGQFSRNGLLNARGILVFVHPALQYSKPVYDSTVAILTFAQAAWFKDGRAGVYTLQNDASGPLGYLIVLKQPLTDSGIDELLAGTHVTELPPTVAFNVPADRRLSWAESMDILRRWEQKRLGWGSPQGSPQNNP